MNIIKAKHLGMCFGVRDAIFLAHSEASKQPITVLGDLVHNETVLASLRQKGVRIAQEPSDVRTRRVLITAHGASLARIQEVQNAGHEVIQATCPLVHLAHNALRNLAEQGYHPVVVGKRDHVEVRGLTGDFAQCDVVLSESDIEQMLPHAKFGVIAQTTQPIERVKKLIAHMRSTFPDSSVRFIDTVCEPTKKRQNAAIEVASNADVVVVIGGASSNNTRELVETCRKYCSQVHHVQTAEELREEWFAGAETVGITAGTSTPDTVISGVEQWLRSLAADAANKTGSGIEANVGCARAAEVLS